MICIVCSAVYFAMLAVAEGGLVIYIYILLIIIGLTGLLIIILFLVVLVILMGLERRIWLIIILSGISIGIGIHDSLVFGDCFCLWLGQVWHSRHVAVADGRTPLIMVSLRVLRLQIHHKFNGRLLLVEMGRFHSEREILNFLSYVATPLLLIVTYRMRVLLFLIKIVVLL